MSGQIPLDPATGVLVDGDIAAQTHRVFANLKAILEAGGASLDHVVRTTVYLADMDDFAAMNDGVRDVFFESRRPRAPPFRRRGCRKTRGSKSTSSQSHR